MRLVGLTACIAMLSLGGCASAPPYIQPSTGETASIAFINGTAFDNLSVVHYAVPLDCRDPLKVANVARGEEVAARVPAGAEWAFSIAVADERRNCIVAGSFRPEKDRSYRASLRADDTACVLSFVSLPGEQRVPFAAKVFSTPFAPSGPYCAPR